MKAAQRYALPRGFSNVGQTLAQLSCYFPGRTTLVGALRHFCADSLAGKIYEGYIRVGPRDEHHAQPTSWTFWEACVLRARRY